MSFYGARRREASRSKADRENSRFQVDPEEDARGGERSGIAVDG
jgi:hypothetical protein